MAHKVIQTSFPIYFFLFLFFFVLNIETRIIQLQKFDYIGGGGGGRFGGGGGGGR